MSGSVLPVGGFAHPITPGVHPGGRTDDLRARKRGAGVIARTVVALGAVILAAGCAATAPPLTGREAYLAAVEGIPFAGGAMGAGNAFCDLKLSGEFTRATALRVGIDAYAVVGESRGPEYAHRHLDAIDAHLCPGPWWTGRR